MLRPSQDLSAFEILFYVLLAGVLAVGVAIAAYDPLMYVNWYVPEDGVIEYATAGFLLAVAVISLWRLLVCRDGKTGWFTVMMVFTAVLFTFGAGEEVSWGQRIFGFESNAFFQENNDQAETNLHNLMVGETKINKIIFGQLLTLVLVLYFLIGPFFYARSERLRALVDRFYIPVPAWHHMLGFGVALIATVLIADGKRAELSEFALSILLFLIVLRPRNAVLFARA
jgi:hypothetical protein